MTSRLFIGLDLPHDVKRDLIKLRDDHYGEENPPNWESDDKLHITVKFLGDVGENLTDLIFQRFENLNFSKINAEFSRFGFFKRGGSLKILFASLRKNEKISEFQRLIENECELIGFSKERRKFSPHITLLRLKGHEDLNKLIKYNNLNIDYPEFCFTTFSVYKSELKPTGSEYTKLKSFNFD